MRIIIVGGGGVGSTLAEDLNAEGHQITLIDRNAERLNSVLEKIDIQGVSGDGVSHEVLKEAGIENTDLLIAVTQEDEVNMLCCLIGKKLGGCQTIARVRNLIYYKEINFIKDELGLSLAINPEFATANEIFNLVQIPSAMTVESFAKGRVNLIQVQIPSGSILDNMSVMDFSNRVSRRTLICILERADTREILIPSGTTVMHAGDSIHIVTPPEEMNAVFTKIGCAAKPSRDIMIVGGGRISMYLAMKLIHSHNKVKIIEKDAAICEELSENLPKASIINGDAIDRQLLHEEGLQAEDAFVALTDMDEENILLSLYASKVSKTRTITKISTIGFSEVLEDLPVGSVVNPKTVTSNNILRYVREMHNSSASSNIESLYYLAGGQAEALEFSIRADSSVTNTPLAELKLKPNLLICCIYRAGRIITPTGRDYLAKGDTVVVVTAGQKLQSINDILR